MDSLRGMKTPPLVKQGLAELMGTMILCTFGIGSVAQFVLAKHELGGFWAVAWGWGFGIAFGIYWSGGVSGGHINPAVTLGLAVCGRIEWKKVPVYVISQLAGSMLGSAIAFAIYHDELTAFAGSARETTGPNATAGIWATIPSENISNWTGFGDQILATALFVGTIFALLDHKNIGPTSNIAPLVIGLIGVTVGACFGNNAGGGLNPARELGPRIFIALAGWGLEPFTHHNTWFIYPILGQLIGGVVGGVIYELTIGIHHECEEEDSYTLEHGHPHQPGKESPLSASPREQTGSSSSGQKGATSSSSPRGVIP